MHFTAIKVEKGKYLFHPIGHSKPIIRAFLHNPLHDYESVWWTAVLFIFSSKPKGVPEDVMVMKKAQNCYELDPEGIQ